MEAASIEAKPNPAKDRAVFSYRLPKEVEQGSITVTDLDGKTVAVFVLESNIGYVEWDIKQLKDGVYLYSLATDKANVTTKRLVIVH